MIRSYGNQPKTVSFAPRCSARRRSGSAPISARLLQLASAPFLRYRYVFLLVRAFVWRVYYYCRLSATGSVTAKGAATDIAGSKGKSCAALPHKRVRGREHGPVPRRDFPAAFQMILMESAVSEPSAQIVPVMMTKRPTSRSSSVPVGVSVSPGR